MNLRVSLTTGKFARNVFAKHIKPFGCLTMRRFACSLALAQLDAARPLHFEIRNASDPRPFGMPAECDWTDTHRRTTPLHCDK